MTNSLTTRLREAADYLSNIVRLSNLLLKAADRIEELEKEWLPIESVPKDGRIVALFSSDADVYAVAYHNGKSAYPWEDLSGGDNWAEDFFSHWRPLPKGPGE